MSRRHVSAAVLASAALLAGCGTGLHARTYQEIGREDGAAANVGGSSGVGVRALYVQPAANGGTLAAGSTAYVTGGLVNSGSTADALIGATSTAAASVQLLQDGKPVEGIPVPAMSAAPTTWSLALVSLTSDLKPTTLVDVTLEFRDAGRITLQVPVRQGNADLQDRSPDQDPYAVD